MAKKNQKNIEKRKGYFLYFLFFLFYFTQCYFLFLVLRLFFSFLTVQWLGFFFLLFFISSFLSFSFLFDSDFFHQGSSPAIDIYLFVYGTDFNRCLKDFTNLSGPVPLPPINSLGHKNTAVFFSSSSVPLCTLCIFYANWPISKTKKKKKENEREEEGKTKRKRKKFRFLFSLFRFC